MGVVNDVGGLDALAEGICGTDVGKNLQIR